jgi:hypothetical protein
VRRQILIAAVTLLASAVLVAALVVAGKLARNSLESTERYQLPFNDIDCPSPPGMARDTFISQVRYYGEFPEMISVLDASLPARLSEAFARHPWVEKVDAIEVGPGRHIRAWLAFRVPVLAVAYMQQTLQVRAADSMGVLLPHDAATQSLPRLTGKEIPPPGTSGRPWGNSQVEGACRLAGLLKPHQPALKLKEFRLQAGLIHLRRDAPSSAPDVIWGQPPGLETGDEPAADVKLRRLNSLADRLGAAAGQATIDLRRD